MMKAARGPEAQQAADAELQAEREHQQDHAQLGDAVEAARVDEYSGRVRPDDHPGDQVADHHRLA